MEALCDAQSAGRRFFTVRGRHAFEVGELLLLALSLPDELVLGIDVEVVAVARSGDDCVARVELAGFSPEMGTRLRSMALRGGASTHRDSAYIRLPPRDPAPDDRDPRSAPASSPGVLTDSARDHVDLSRDRARDEVELPRAEDSGAVLAALRPRRATTGPARAARPGTPPPRPVERHPRAPTPGRAATRPDKPTEPPEEP